MATSALVAQLYGLIRLRASMEWRQGLPPIVGGVFGNPLGLLVLRSIDPHIFRIGFGVFLTIYATCH